MPAGETVALITALAARGVRACVGGGWAVDALLGEQTRPHSDLDVWITAAELEPLLVVFAGYGIDRIYPWPGDRPWNFVLHDGRTRRVDLHIYEPLGNGLVHYGSVTDPFVFAERELSERGLISGVQVRCERAEWAVQCHLGYQPRDTDRHDVARLCERFGMAIPDGYR